MDARASLNPMKSRFGISTLSIDGSMDSAEEIGIASTNEQPERASRRSGNAAARCRQEQEGRFCGKLRRAAGASSTMRFAEQRADLLP
jgi:hypothetical protein